MRKQDYTLLAALIAAEIKTYQDLSSGAPRLDTLTRLARQFADRASVNKTEFLKACGIE